MCGICGALGFGDALALAKRMNSAMVHRGPDSEGFVDAGNAALAVRRLRIIDVSTGDQPIYNEESSVAVILNGEIYNWREIALALRDRGHRFRSRSDTEVIVHAYEEWGEGCLRHLRGMFAVAIYDGRTATEGRVILARDRLGIKPLYLWQDGQHLLFASEVRALLASGCIPSHLSLGGLYTYLALGSVQEPLTMIEGVHSLEPASYLRVTVCRSGLRVIRGTFWDPPSPHYSQARPQEVRQWLSDAVGTHLASDVPLGVFLSGGLDSGCVAALASRAAGQPMRTFTMAFDNWPADESHLADLTAHHLGASHHCQSIDCRAFLDDVPKAIADMDQPTVDGINTWFVSREARRSGLTVALSGLGGDELFAGYPSFQQVPRLKRLAQSGTMARVLGKFASAVRLGSPDGRSKLAAFLAGRMPLTHAYFAVRGLFTGPQIHSLLLAPIRRAIAEGDPHIASWRQAVACQVQLARRYDWVGEVSWLELSQYMRSTLLRDTDAMSMAHSLEVRVPLLDYVLVERVLSLSGECKQVPGRVKPLLARAMEGVLPAQVITAPKRTFTLPFEMWLRQGLSLPVRKCLLGGADALTPWLDPTAIASVWADFEGGKTNWARPWALYVVHEWARQHL